MIIKILILFVTYALINSISMSALPINAEIIDLDIKYFGLQTILSLVFTINSSSVTMIVFYLSELTCEQIDQLIVDCQLKQNQFDYLGILYTKMLAIKKNIITMNKSVSFGLFVKLIEFGLSMSSLGCLLALTLQQDDLRNINNVSRIIGKNNGITKNMRKFGNENFKVEIKLKLSKIAFLFPLNLI